MTFPSPEVARAVGSSKEFLDWMVSNSIQDFTQAWLRCFDGLAMFKVLVALNPAFKDLHWVSMRAALRVVDQDGDLDEQLLDHLARKKAALEAGTEGYDGEAAIERAISLNRILRIDDRPSKGQAHMAVGWACCKATRSCGMALESASCAERFRLEERERQGYVALASVSEPSLQANDIREFFPLPLTMNKIRYPSRYKRPWVI
jgi:hypothetical protein